MASIELDTFYLEVAEELPPRYRDKLITAIVRKIAYNEEPETLPAMLKATYKALKPMIDRAAANVQNGKKGGRPKTQAETQLETQLETQPITQVETQIETQNTKTAVYINSKDLNNTENTENNSNTKDSVKQEIENNNNNNIINNTIDLDIQEIESSNNNYNTKDLDILNTEIIENNNINSYITPYSPPLDEAKTETEAQAGPQTRTQHKTQIAETADRVIDYLNLKAGTSYRHGIAKTLSLIGARLKDGFTEDDFTLVINNKCAEWIGTDYAKYLRPETLFGTKFESYLNQIPQKSKTDPHPARKTVPKEKRIPWVPDEVYEQPDFGCIYDSVYPYDGVVEYIDCNNGYARWVAPDRETAMKIDADYRAYAAERDRRRKESETK